MQLRALTKRAPRPTQLVSMITASRSRLRLGVAILRAYLNNDFGSRMDANRHRRTREPGK